MSKRNLSLFLGVVLLISVIAIVLFYPQRTQEEGFGCQSDTVSRKTYSTGESTGLSLTTLFLFNSSDIVTVIHKGVFIRGDKRYLIDRNYVLNVEKVAGSDIYYIKGKKVHKSDDDVAPDGVVNELLLDSIDFFYVTRLKSHAWLIKGLVLPIMMCVAVPTS
ncbi:hypothetical protein SJ090_20280 [Enterobacter cloacae]|jgi:hypothetical protein|uniref:Uncharacterized protein n=1 Tax=Enterobacter cloacae TaxID=550 RepID=A0A3R9A1Y9_ENTCL|nr:MULTISPECIES: hypothetical protein [Enterobacter]AFM57821.1 hypothetical protein A3UG_00340 [Enterobacter cloacae subsp. dissolvens SDM]ELE9014450.1 hypothetical protein [Enterobacter cloacae]ELE9706326.1 hypothetical protein [Enterobacter cloacae]ELK7333666.1 hypothetical protein [Enterobacter cloacae]ELK7441023.1 hypothetical protein [Enterobacter cloacae]